ncbi:MULTISPECIES: GNAT family N-acetyltransferase [Paenibacillus]|uniref:GNAT family N-acetyltransferase n=1 Tax=Paenibacillus TaxID=44249 RepID=UPI00096DFD3D|nr:GNAT family N-acetyltransferase [Paenibacillus odorifer]OMC93935.1 GNAT family N-acetyltransferase [Paenibacillus odorifer]OMD03545.1 GNAT family N-acetyltransferase [Paenibacillus odorifer]
MIREAVPKDAINIEELYRILLPEHPAIHVSPERLKQIADHPDSFLYVYEEQGIIVGSLHLHFCMDALCDDRPFAVIERVIVAEKVRGKGYGAMLMRHAENVAIFKGALKIMLSSAAKREEAHRFYEHLGYDGSSSKLFKKYL